MWKKIALTSSKSALLCNLFYSYLMLTHVAAEGEKISRQSNHFVPKTQIVENSDASLTKIQLNANTSCTSPYAQLDISVKGEGDTLLIFSALPNPEGENIKSLICRVHFVSAPRYVMSMVLLEHTFCNGDVVVVLSDTSWRRRWHMCSALQVPGPDFLTSSNMADISVEFRGVTDLFEVTISVMAAEKPEKGELVLRHLSAKEGKIVFVLKKKIAPY